MPVQLKVPVQGEALDEWDDLSLPADGFGDGPCWRNVGVAQEARDEPLILEKKGRAKWAYSVADPDWDLPHLAGFSTVVQVVSMFQDDDVLAAGVTWSSKQPNLELWFDKSDRSPAYDPTTGRLKLPWYRKNGRVVHSARSRDIVAHETGHAVLNALAPDLADAITPQSLAIHEAIADLVAFVSSLQSKALRRRVLDNGAEGRSKSETLSVFAGIAESYAKELGRHSWLRSLQNTTGLPECEAPMQALEAEQLFRPHYLGQVLGGALYDMAPPLFEFDDEPNRGWALFQLAKHFKRFVLRALTYLPPGELTFEDLARLVLAADAAVHPRNADGPLHEAFLTTLRRRGVDVTPAPSLARGIRLDLPSHEPSILALLLSKGPLRELLAPLPKSRVDISISVQDVCKRVTQRVDLSPGRLGEARFQTVRIPERVVKLRWCVRERGADGEGDVEVPIGATVVLDELGWVRFVLRGTPEGHIQERRSWIARAKSLGLVGDDATSPVWRQLLADGLHRYRGTGRYLHLH